MANAAAQVKNAIDATYELGGENYVFWGGREGYESLLNSDIKREQEQMARFLHMAVDYKQKIGFKLILNKNIKSFFENTYGKAGIYTKADKIKYVDIVFPTGVFIFQEHVITVVADEKVTAFDIKSKQNAEKYKEFFFSIWNKN